MNLQDELSSIKQGKASGSPIDTGAFEESGQLENLAGTLDIVIKKVNEKTAAFRTEAATVNGVVDNEVAALNKMLSVVEKITDSAEKLSTSIAGDSLKNIAKDFEPLSKIDMSELKILNELNKTKYGGKAANSLAKQSKQFLDTQNKQINDDLKRYRKAGLSEYDLQPLKETKELLNSTFNTSGLFDMGDINGEMSAFVSMLSEAENKCDSIAASLKAASDATATAESSVSKYNTLLNKEKTLLNKRLKNGSWTHPRSGARPGRNRWGWGRSPHSRPPP